MTHARLGIPQTPGFILPLSVLEKDSQTLTLPGTSSNNDAPLPIVAIKEWALLTACAGRGPPVASPWVPRQSARIRE